MLLLNLQYFPANLKQRELPADFPLRDIGKKIAFSQNMVDCPSENFLTNHGLKPGDQMQFSVKIRNQARGEILAVAELASFAPFKLHSPRHKGYPFAVKVRKVKPPSGNKFCMRYPHAHPPPMNPSHW